MSVRLSPTDRYKTELAARIAHLNFAQLCSHALNKYYETMKIFPEGANSDATVANSFDKLWDVDLPERLAKLALFAPHLLNMDEQITWKVVMQTPWFWEKDDERTKLLVAPFKAAWHDILRVAKGELTSVPKPE